MSNNKNNDYPSLLLITRRNVLTDTDSTSVTIRSFLGYWPKDKLTLICCEDFNVGDNGRVSKQCYQLTNANVVLGSSFFKTNNRNTSSAVGSPVITRSKSLIHRLKSWIKHMGYLFYTSLPYKESKDLDSFIRERRPEIIYSNFTNLRMLRLVNLLAKRYDLPVIPHFFDDWPNVYMEQGSIGFHTFSRELEKMFKRSRFILCISPKMCEEYKKRYRIEKAYPLLNSVEPNQLERKNESKEFILFFAGSLYLGRHKTLLSMCKCIKEQEKENVRVQICAPQAQWEQFCLQFNEYGFVKYCGFLSSEELAERISNANCLVFAESFDDNYLKFTSLSLSTRVPEYLSTGVPIMALGNRQQGSLEYLADNHAAYVAFNSEDIPLCLDRCLNHEDETNILESAKRLFNENHLRSNQEKRFYSLIKSALN